MEVSPRTHLFREISFLLKCPICQETMDNCVVNSSCGHSFCKVCASRHTTFRGGNSCPLCRKEIDYMSNNYIVNDIIDSMKEKNVHEKKYMNKTCEALTRCQVCQTILEEGDQFLHKTRKINGKTIPTLVLCTLCKY